MARLVLALCTLLAGACATTSPSACSEVCNRLSRIVASHEVTIEELQGTVLEMMSAHEHHEAAMSELQDTVSKLKNAFADLTDHEAQFSSSHSGSGAARSLSSVGDDLNTRITQDSVVTTTLATVSLNVTNIYMTGALFYEDYVWRPRSPTASPTEAPTPDPTLPPTPSPSNAPSSPTPQPTSCYRWATFGASGINSGSALGSSGWSYDAASINSASYTTSSSFLTFFNSGNSLGYIQKALPGGGGIAKVRWGAVCCGVSKLFVGGVNIETIDAVVDGDEKNSDTTSVVPFSGGQVIRIQDGDGVTGGNVAVAWSIDICIH
jgi:hypothetical protein